MEIQEMTAFDIYRPSFRAASTAPITKFNNYRDSTGGEAERLYYGVGVGWAGQAIATHSEYPCFSAV